MGKLEDLKAAQATVAKLIKDDGRALIRDFFDGLFAANPQIRKFRWTQDTPSWNDGDPCEFSVGDLEAIIEDPDDAIAERDEDDEEDLFQDMWNARNLGLKGDPNGEFTELANIDGLFDGVFGDNVKVTVNRDEPGFVEDSI